MDLDQDTLDRLRAYCGHDPCEPQLVTREVFEESGTRYWTPAEFLAAISAAIENIPADRRADATVELSTNYDEYGYLKITYEGMETPEEVANNLRRYLERIREQQQRERLQYETLKAKYGP